jgi:hypothetical protein
MEIEDLPPKYQAQARAKLAAGAADAQPTARNEPLAAEKVTRFDRPVRVSVLIKRHRLTDPDEKGGRCKYFVDALVSAGLLRDDSNKEISSYNQEQVKVPKAEAQETIITIEEEA